MASPDRRLDTNAEGDFYVDDSCIDCATCRWMAPETFDQAGEYSRVHTQPSTPEARVRAAKALLACPTSSIGTARKDDLCPVRDAFPDPIAENVHHCGFHAESSFGAASYLIVREAGNIMIDSPRFNAPLARRIEELGGIRWMFLTHQDDVADHEKFRERFGCERILHADENRKILVDRRIEGLDPVPLTDDALMIPTPGHTKGSTCLLYREKYLFTGDHLAYSPDREHLYAFRGACWYDWDTLIESMKRLAEHRFEHVLPGHGWPKRYDAEQMPAEMRRCIEWMQR